MGMGDGCVTIGENEPGFFHWKHVMSMVVQQVRAFMAAHRDIVRNHGEFVIYTVAASPYHSCRESRLADNTITTAH
jgi:hypothetical protein